jgi:hypothetical protein
MREESPWCTWIEHGPELGYTAELDSFSFPASVEVGLQISGIHDQACSGFFPLSELEACGFSPNKIAGIENLLEIKRLRKR